MLRGKTALVTGSTSGIGLGIARALAAQGANIVVNGFGDAEAIAGIEKELQAQGVATMYHGADMSKPSQIEDMVRAAESRFGRIDVLVNNAGIQHVAPIEDFPVERWDAVIAINLSSAFHAMRVALPGMKRRNWGRVINLASVHGLVASAQKSAYVAAKHGIVGLTKVVALETATTGVTCNAICPGWVLTPLVQKQVDARAARDNLSQEDAKKALLREKQPSMQFVTTEQLADRIREPYRRLVGNTDLTVALVRGVGMNVYVSGEIKLASLQSLDGSLTLLQAIARAGGTLVSANTSNVLLVRNDGAGNHSVRKVDLEAILRGEAPDVPLRRRDVVYVPKSEIAQAGQFVDQYINALVPDFIQFQLGWFNTRSTNSNPVVELTP